MPNLTAEQLERLVFALESDNHHDILFALGLGGSNANRPTPAPVAPKRKRQKRQKKQWQGNWTAFIIIVGLLLIVWAATIIHHDYYYSPKNPLERVGTKSIKRL